VGLGSCLFALKTSKIAALLGCKESTLRRRPWSEIISAAQALAESELLRRQIELAKSGNPIMLIWLGKQFLGQVDRKTVDSNVYEVKAPKVFVGDVPWPESEQKQERDSQQVQPQETPQEIVQ